MKILDTLASGPQPWEGLLNGSSRSELDIQLRLLCKSQQIILRGDGKYHLWPQSPPDNPLLDKGREHHPCPICENPVYRKDAVTCSKECQAKNQLKKRPKCKVCGELVNRMRSTYCSKQCQDLGMTGRSLMQKCRSCRRYRRRNEFPAACRGYEKSLCYPCIGKQREAVG